MDFDKLATEIMSLAMGVGISNRQSHELVRAKMEMICRDYACRWGGRQRCRRDRAEELEKRAIAAEVCLEEIKLTVGDESGTTSRNIVRVVERHVKEWEALDL